MKEYLLRTSEGKYFYLSDDMPCCPAYVEKIEIPDGAECCTQFEDNIIFWCGTKNRRPFELNWFDIA